MIHDVAARIAGIGILAIICQWLFSRLGHPAIAFALTAGMIAGPVTGWLQPDALFGILLFAPISLCVAVILLEGSLSLRVANIRGAKNVVITIDLGEDENLDTFTARNPDAIPLYAAVTKGKVHVSTSTVRASMSQGWKLIAIFAMFINYDCT